MAMNSCGCDYGISNGPAVLAADFLRRCQLGGKVSPGQWPSTMLILLLVYTGLQGDKPVLVDFDDLAERVRESVEQVRTEVAWLVEHEFLALDGDVDGVARIWVNPSVAFLPGTDPRVAAARYRFPYIDTAEGGMGAEEPVIVYPYEPEVWNAVYDAQREMFEDPPVFRRCPAHAV
ncbi:hypothetical protein ACFWHQ_35650 [Streptomyces sp. NPDC060334]|uniref:hypothetical protein n=1 Tax=Streptomyces sp. NPDC060334 TaxID=3347099 RepID=UPI003663928E